MKKLFIEIISLLLAVTLTACGGKTERDDKTLLVAATSKPHGDILEEAKNILKDDYDIDLEIKILDDYYIFNRSLNDGDVDANFFQHQPYLDEFAAEHSVKLVSAGGGHIEPMGIYSKKVKALDELKDGALVAIPNDPTNGGRALILMAKAGIITLKDNNDIKATVQDVVANPKNIQFQEVEAAQLPRVLDDVDAAVINTNYAMQAGFVPASDALIIEDSTSPYVNIVAVREGDQEKPAIQKLMKALKSEAVKKFIEEKYKGAVVPAFE